MRKELKEYGFLLVIKDYWIKATSVEMMDMGGQKRKYSV